MPAMLRCVHKKGRPLRLQAQRSAPPAPGTFHRSGARLTAIEAHFGLPEQRLALSEDRCASPEQRFALPEYRLLFPNADLLFPNTDLLFPKSDLLFPNADLLLLKSDLLFPNADLLFPKSDLLFGNGDLLFPRTDLLSRQEVNPAQPTLPWRADLGRLPFAQNISPLPGPWRDDRPAHL
ncbi:hypothetical protein [Pseudoxanthomonas gei]|uniref:hypothetical protein n=1 Tax=Pseudoxanthomonas gei TaxID=1383030 RepID=UPI001391E230|nr:hypothetical protein [Pseudoxanthomonas gei]